MDICWTSAPGPIPNAARIRGPDGASHAPSSLLEALTADAGQPTTPAVAHINRAPASDRADGLMRDTGRQVGSAVVIEVPRRQRGVEQSTASSVPGTPPGPCQNTWLPVPYRPPVAPYRMVPNGLEAAGPFRRGSQSDSCGAAITAGFN